MKQALFWKALKGKMLQCQLCPHCCVIKERGRGKCGVRENQAGRLVSLVYGRPCSANLDHIEKKPFYHFLPGEYAFSFGTAGCNLRCLYCQNWEISQARPENIPSFEMSPGAVVMETLSAESRIISYTYTEPTIFYEYVLDSAKLAVKKKIRNTIVSNGFINQEPLKKLLKYLHGANIDFKGNAAFYRKITGAWFEPVGETMKALKRAGIWLELTNLVVPTLNDKPQDIRWLVDWVVENLGLDVPLHFSAFFPAYKLKRLPSTSIAKLREAREIGLKAGLHYVYTGNIPDEEGSTTFCPECGEPLIRRSGFFVTENKVEDGKCPACRARIAGIWK